MESALELDTSEWGQEILDSEKLTVVYFWHEQCPWCMRLNPIFNELSEEYSGKIKFVKLNVLDNPNNREIAALYGVMSTPTLMFFCSGRPIGQTVSFMPKEQLKNILDDMLERHKQCIKQSTDLRSYIV